MTDSSEPLLIEQDCHGVKLNLKFPASGHFVFREIFEAEIYKIPPQYQQDPCVIVDIGGHFGFFSTYMAAQFPKAKIHSYEPVKDNFSYLTANSSAFPNIICHNYGIHDETKECMIYLTGKTEAEYSIYGNPDSEFQEMIQLKCVTDEFAARELPHIDILKIDTEGCELKILNGLGQPWLEKISVIFLEYHHEDTGKLICRWLDALFEVVAHVEDSAHRGTLTLVSRRR